MGYRLTQARLATIAGIGILVLKVALSAPQLRDDLALVAITWFVVTAFVVVGLALFATDIPTVNGWACLTVAAATIPGDLNNPAYPQALVLGGFVLEPLYLAAAVALVLRYPAARLTKPGRFVVWGLVATGTVMRVPLALTRGSLPSPLHASVDRSVWALSPWWHDWVFLRATFTATALLLAVAGGMLVVRAVRSRGVTRQSLAPLAIVGAICATSAALDQIVWILGVPGAAWAAVALARNLSAAAIPAALLADLLRRRAAAAAVTSEILRAASSGDLALLEGALRHVLLDPSLTVTPVVRQSEASGDGVETRENVDLMSEDGNALVAVGYDPRAVGDPTLLRGALAAAQLGIEKTRLTLELLERMEELRASRARIVEAGMAERRRVERDLHDGAQQQFLAVVATLAQSDFATDEQMRDLVGQARSRLTDALAELRQLARGIHPATLSQGGLSAALPYLCQSAPEPVSLRLDPALADHRLEPGVESAVYFVVAEGLANVTRYAAATSATVTVLSESEYLSIEVADDGNGQAHFTAEGGLTGLRDRVHALDGDLTLHCDPCADHPLTHGSRLRVGFPLNTAHAS
jgi:signal transduction histidine kinase